MMPPVLSPVYSTWGRTLPDLVVGAGDDGTAPCPDALFSLSRACHSRCRDIARTRPHPGECLQQGGQFYGANGCDACRGTGYRGRTGIYELLVIDDTIRTLVMQQANANTIKTAALQRGMRTLLDDGARKVLQGRTTRRSPCASRRRVNKCLSTTIMPWIGAASSLGALLMPIAPERRGQSSGNRASP